MPLATPEVTVENNQTYVRWGTLRYWIDDLGSETQACVEQACANVGESTDHSMLEAEIDGLVDSTPSASAVYLDAKKWELA